MRFHPSSALQFLVGSAVVLTAVIFTTAAADPVNIIKLTVLLLCAVAGLAVAGVALARRRWLQLPWGAPAATGVLLAVAFVVSALSTADGTSAVWGSYGRNSGLLAYGSALVLYWVVLTVFDGRSVSRLLFSFVAAGGFTAAYGGLQYLGLDAISWNSVNPVLAGMGNPNFVGGYLAICLPALVWWAVTTASPALRGVAVGAAGLAFTVMMLSKAAQGPVAAGCGLAVLATAWLLGQRSRLRRSGLIALAGTGAAAAAGLGFGATGTGPVAGVFQDTGTKARGWFWQAAVDMWRDEPVLGVGLERFGAQWRVERSVEAIRGLGGEDLTDAAHSVPLHLLATGGLTLVLAYVGFVALTAWALGSGLRRLHGRDRLLLGALGGSWTAYQVQSLVSIDQVPLLVAHYVLAAGVIVAAGRSRSRTLVLPGAVQRGDTPRGGGGPRDLISRRVTAVDRAVVGALLCVALGAGWWVMTPLRASMAAHDGDAALARGEGTPALVAYARAAELQPGEPRYWQQLGSLFLRAERPDEALRAFRRGIAADAEDVAVIRGAATAAAALGDDAEAAAFHERALELHPSSPSVVRAAAAFFVAQGEFGQAELVLSGAAAVVRDDIELWIALGDVRQALHDGVGARAAFTRAAALDPGRADVAERLNAVGTAGA